MTAVAIRTRLLRAAVMGLAGLLTFGAGAALHQPPAVAGAVGVAVEPVRVGLPVTPAPTVPAMAPLPVQTAPPKPPAWVSPVVNRKCYPDWGGREFGAPRYDSAGNWDHAHGGIDLGSASGVYDRDPIRAVGAGVVVAAGWSGGAGNRVNIRHADGSETRYQHLSRIDVAKGQAVTAGQHIGLVGNTGHSFGPHLHFETRTNGTAVDPVDFLAARGVRIACG